MGQLETERQQRDLLQDLPPEKLEALIEIMYLAAIADGDFSPEERVHFLTSIESLTDHLLETHKLAELLARFDHDLADSGRAARLEHAKARLPEMGARRVALALAIRMTTADRVIRTTERELILELAEALGIDNAEAADLVREIAG